MKRLIVWLFIFAAFPMVIAHASSLANQSSLKVTVWMNGDEYEWEYTNPNEFEFEKGNKVIKGNKAEAKVKDIYNLLHISKDAKVEDMVSALKKHGYNDIDRLDVRVIDRDDALFTWVWHKN
ncbi:hypothetical protein EV207_10138 [Scopulibacillus darangshiensis]|uniref:Uncharacterized protein n=1 Tax=Scopulibacillus darangshiensis TaxID=442528 RepID=A0A4V6NQR5_9BACL|nr:hypothetical protein [Scopulibacillus darangshiensis]TCP32066.1 hypothetical protein EV207_10138 [Scopulibacillus darangshiensis]